MNDRDYISDRVSIVPITGCWMWMAAIHWTGYGVGKDGLAHRHSYEAFVGPIPSGLQIDHLCRNRWCVNPAHLEAVTQKVNIMRGHGFGAKNARRTHCPRGHPYSDTNTKVWVGADGCRRRACIACKVLTGGRRYPKAPIPQ